LKKIEDRGSKIEDDYMKESGGPIRPAALSLPRLSSSIVHLPTSIFEPVGLQPIELRTGG
jgi:hypothetical protein